MITANVIHRVFRVSTGPWNATAFTVDVAGRQYLVTAKHVAGHLSSRDTLNLSSNGTWVPFPIEIIGHAPGDVDVSVLAISQQLSPGLPMEPTSDGMAYGQDAYFLGFPYDILPRYVFGSAGYPLPLVKRATISCFDTSELLLDGHNNPGFSGGPVVFCPAGKREFRVAAIISGFRAVPEPVLGVDGAETDLFYQHNTGIIVAHDIRHALALIQANPQGFQLPASSGAA